MIRDDREDSAQFPSAESAFAEFQRRRRSGERVELEEFCREHPQYADGLRALYASTKDVLRGDRIETTRDEVRSAGGRESASSPPTFPGLEVVEEIAPGVGGMGQVYRARDKSLDRIVAVKTTQKHLRSEEGRRFFEREARSAARLDHPGIIKIFSFHPDHDPPYYVMQFLEGRPLDQACKGRDARVIARTVSKTARALSYAHSFGILHRDIKPANILVDYEGEPHIADFGLAKGSPPTLDEGSVEVSSPRGTPAFMAPELYHADEPVTRAIDIYSLGVTLYFLLTGAYPFRGRNLEEMRDAVLAGDVPLPMEINANVPEPLQRICLKAMERDPEARYDTADALADDLDRYLAGQEVFVRPRRYLSELHGKLRNHMTEVQLWRQQNLVGLRQMDRILRPYRMLLAADRIAEEHSRRFPWEMLCLRLGGWLVLVSSLLWPVYYWDRMEPFQRVLSLGLPALLINLVGWIYHVQRSRVNSIAFLSIGAVLLPLFLATVLSEYRILRFPQDTRWELFGDSAVQGSAPIREQNAPAGSQENEALGAAGTVGADPVEGRIYAPCNSQLLVCALAFLGYGVLLLYRSGARIFVLLSGVGLYALFSTVLLLVGLREWLEEERVTWALLLYLLACVFFVPLSRRFERQERIMWASTAYCFFPAVFVVLMSLLAYHAGIEWFDARARRWETEEPIQLWAMGNGIVYIVLAFRSSRSRLSYVRFWGEFFFLCVPLSLLIPVNLLFKEGVSLFELGSRPVTIYELLAVLISLTILVLGSKLGRFTLSLPGLLGLATWVFRATYNHFRDSLDWPLFLAVLGGVSMAAAVGLNLLRARRRRDGEVAGSSERGS